MSITDSPVASTRIRDLPDEEFRSSYGCDRFTASVIVNRLKYAVGHMSTAFMREAFSPIIRDWYDFACTISGPPERGYGMAVVSNSLTPFLGTMPDAARNTVDEFGPENLSPGDVLICNDPYRGGRHVNDVLFIRPVFVDGKIVTFVNMCAHQLDMGGTVPGGFSATKLNVYDNGLVVPPMLLWSKDKPVRSTFSLIFDNTRWGGLLLPDFKSIHQQLKLGERLVRENIERYGVDAYLGSLDYACDTSAEQMREAIARIPDGDYTGTGSVDADGMDDTIVYTVQVTLRKRGHDIEADLSGTSAQARTCINGQIYDAKTALGVSLTMLLDPKIPFTSGTWRNVDLVTPPGTLLTAMPPEGPTMMYWEASGALIAAIFNALNPVLGSNAVGGDYGSTNIVNANGVRPDGSPWTSATQVGGEHGPWGGTKEGDGDSYTVMYNLNNLDPATETIEHDSPIVVLRKEHVMDMGGPGAHRGGAATRKDSLWLTDAEHYISPFRYREPSGVGANGGVAGPTGGIWIFPPTGGAGGPSGLIPTSPEVYADSTPVAGVLAAETKVLDPVGGVYHYFAKEKAWRTKAGAVLRVVTNGGGGWGAPFERDPQAVLADVRNEYVSVEGAARDYGVVVTGDPHFDPEGICVDEEATTALRTRSQHRTP